MCVEVDDVIMGCTLVCDLFVLPLAWSLSKVLTPLFHSSICSCRGLIRPSMKVL